MSITYQVTRGCTFCGTCVDECPIEAIEMGLEGAKIDQEKCTGCGVCEENCASEAITPIVDDCDQVTAKDQVTNREKELSYDYNAKTRQLNQ